MAPFPVLSPGVRVEPSVLRAATLVDLSRFPTAPMLRRSSPARGRVRGAVGAVYDLRTGGDR